MHAQHRSLIDCVVVGAGPAGLASSIALTDRGVDHVVLERGRVGQSWRTQRWDSFRLNNPGWMNPMLGEQPRSSYLTGAEVVERLDAPAATCPIRADLPVTRLSPDGDRWAVQTGDRLILARTVLVATGGENVRRIPASARAIPDGSGSTTRPTTATQASCPKGRCS
jgi:putative flavoprotein involved in K+ transport